MTGSSLPIVLLVSILPSITLLGILICKSDPGRKSSVGKVFFLGVLGAVPAFILELIMVPLANLAPVWLKIPARTFLGIALPEEVVKLVLILWFLPRPKSLLKLPEILIYALAVAGGFALFENILYTLSADAPLEVALLRSFTTLPLHLLAAGVMSLALGKKIGKGRGGIAWALIIAVLIHGFYNLILMETKISGWLSLIPLAGGHLFLFLKLKKYQSENGLPIWKKGR